MLSRHYHMLPIHAFNALTRPHNALTIHHNGLTRPVNTPHPIHTQGARTRLPPVAPHLPPLLATITKNPNPPRPPLRPLPRVNPRRTLMASPKESVVGPRGRRRKRTVFRPHPLMPIINTAVLLLLLLRLALALALVTESLVWWSFVRYAPVKTTSLVTILTPPPPS